LTFSHVFGLFFSKIIARVLLPPRFNVGLGQFGGRVRLDEIFAVKVKLRADEAVFFG
jgi:hypothetical protein